MITYNLLKKLMERFTSITYNISFIFTYLLHSGRHGTHFIWMRGWVNNFRTLRLWNLSLSILKRKTSFLYIIFLFANTLFPPVNKLFLSVTKFSIYFSPYISISGLVPMTYVLPLLRVPLHEASDFQLFWFMLNVHWRLTDSKKSNYDEIAKAALFYSWKERLNLFQIIFDWHEIGNKALNFVKLVNMKILDYFPFDIVMSFLTSICGCKHVNL